MKTRHFSGILAAAVLTGIPCGAAWAQNVINQNTTIHNSLCVGFDCADTETYGAMTIMLKENNLRIAFIDTSVGAFPTRDWQIVANDTTSGGQERFSIEDLTSGGTPFTIEGAARSNSLYVDSGGRIGLRTSNPVTEMHMVDGDTPTLRLQQDESSGFAPQTWDIAANETSFFVRDATNGSTLPFRIFPNSQSNTLVVYDDKVGIGTIAPAAPLHIRKSVDAATELVRLTNAGGSYVTMKNTVVGNEWYMTSEHAAPNRLIFSRSDGAGAQMSLTQDGELLLSSSIAGAAPVSARGLLKLRSKGGSFITMENTATGGSWFLSHEKNAPNRFLVSHSSGGIQMSLNSGGDLTLTGELFTAGSCSAGCDRVFDADYPLPSIDEQTRMMLEKRHLPNVGPTPEEGPFNITAMTGGMLNELEKAHLYISQLNARLADQDRELQRLAGLDQAVAKLNERLAELEAAR